MYYIWFCSINFPLLFSVSRLFIKREFRKCKLAYIHFRNSCNRTVRTHLQLRKLKIFSTDFVLGDFDSDRLSNHMVYFRMLLSNAHPCLRSLRVSISKEKLQFSRGSIPFCQIFIYYFSISTPLIRTDSNKTFFSYITLYRMT